MTLTQGHSCKVKVTGRNNIKFVSGPYLSYGEILEVLTSHKDCLWPKGVSWPWNKVIWARSRSLTEKVQNLCPVHIFLMEKHWKFLIHIKDCFWPKGVEWPWSKVIWARSRSLGKIVQNSCPVIIFLMEEQWMF